MKENLKFSEQLLRDALSRLQPDKPTSTAPEILYDEDVMKLLKISRTTLYNYRKGKQISFTKLGGRNIYFRKQLINDLRNTSKNPGSWGKYKKQNENAGTP